MHEERARTRRSGTRSTPKRREPEEHQVHQRERRERGARQDAGVASVEAARAHRCRRPAPAPCRPTGGRGPRGARRPSDLHPGAGARPAHDQRGQRVDQRRWSGTARGRRPSGPGRRRPPTIRRSGSRSCAPTEFAAGLQDVLVDVKIGLMMIATAIASPRARPRPSIAAADDAAAAEREDHGPDHPPAGAAEGERRFLLAGRRLGEHLADHRRGGRHRPSARSPRPP